MNTKILYVVIIILVSFIISFILFASPKACPSCEVCKQCESCYCPPPMGCPECAACQACPPPNYVFNITYNYTTCQGRNFTVVNSDPSYTPLAYEYKMNICSNETIKYVCINSTWDASIRKASCSRIVMLCGNEPWMNTIYDRWFP